MIKFNFSLNSNKILKYLIGLSCLFFILSISIQTVKFYLITQNIHLIEPIRLIFRFLDFYFYLDNEQNFPTYYSSILLLFCSILSYKISISDMKNKKWIILSTFFLYMSIDEFCCIHEQINAPLRDFLSPTGFLYFPWVIIGIPILGSLFCVLKFILKAENYNVKKTFIKAFLLYVFGCSFIEMTSAFYSYDFGTNNLIYAIITSFEEFFEMLGISYFIFALNLYMANDDLKFITNLNDNKQNAKALCKV